MKISGFPIHGEFKSQFFPDERLVISEITGPWNVELVQAWGKSIEPLFDQLDPKAANGAIAHHHVSILNTPQAVDLHRAIIKKGVNRYGLVAIASVVAPGVEGASLAEKLLANVYSGVVEHQIFSCPEEARVWMKAKLAPQGQ
jgi:hypothetical protein